MANFLIAIIIFISGFVLGALMTYWFNRQQTQHNALALKGLCNEALQNNNQLFLDLAHSTLNKFQAGAQHDLEKRQQAIEHFMQPVKSSLEKFDQKMQDIEKTRVGAYSGLSEQIKSLLASEIRLQQETGNLVKALRTPQVRGRWGEIQLQRVVELAGMQEYCDFQQQMQITHEDKRLRPDLIIRLPNQKNIIVDAKAPLWSFLEALELTDEPLQKQKMRNHARLIREHMQALGQKSYWAQFTPTPEFVILFLPGEMFFSAALEQDPSLIEQGVNQQVLLATPTTLIALLKAVAYGWRQDNLAQDAQHIAQLGQTLSKRLHDMHQHFSGLGQQLQKTVDTYNKTLGTYETRVLVTARRFQELNSTAVIKENPDLIDISVREIKKVMTEDQPSEKEAI